MGWKQKIKYIYNCLTGKSIYLNPQININYNYIGNDYGGFAICENKLPSNPIVYSFGVGEDISFDLSMLASYNAKIYAFDPTPKAIKFINEPKSPRKITGVCHKCMSRASSIFR